MNANRLMTITGIVGAIATTLSLRGIYPISLGTIGALATAIIGAYAQGDTRNV